jgi:hypothetical protein
MKMSNSNVKLISCYHCKNKSPKEDMIKLEVDLPSNLNKPNSNKKGYRYYHHECYYKKPSYYHLKKIFESNFEKVFTHINNKIKAGNFIPFKDVSNFLYFKMPFRMWRTLFDEFLMKYIRKELKQSILDYSATGYLQEILDKYELKRELYIVDREKGNAIRGENTGLYHEKRIKK